MRWPFGPPHLTLKPSKKTKQQKTKKNKNKKNKNKKTERKNRKTKTKENQEPTPKTIQQQNKNKANKTETKATQTPKTNTRNTRNTKTPKPFNPKNKQEEATPEKPKKLGKKQAFLTLLELCQTHQKQTTITLKPQKNKPQKHHFAMFKNNPLFFINFLFFSTYHFCFWKAVFCWKHYKNSVFSKTQLFKNTVSKTHFFNHVKKHLFQRKGVIFGFGQFPLKPLFL